MRTKNPEQADRILMAAARLFAGRRFHEVRMEDIADAAGFGKGTLYRYFKDKEELFEAIVGQQCRAQAEQIFNLDPQDQDVEGVLTRLGIAYAQFLCRPGGVSPIRAVIAIAERMPELGRRFYETGPAFGIAQLKAYLSAQVAAGVLEIEDCEIAAAQLMEACLATVYKPVLFNFGTAPAPERIEYVVKIAVRVFLAAYQPH